jgi:hypothetical protein
MSLQVDDIVRLPTGDMALIAAGPFLTWPVSYAISFDGIIPIIQEVIKY